MEGKEKSQSVLDVKNALRKQFDEAKNKGIVSSKNTEEQAQTLAEVFSEITCVDENGICAKVIKRAMMDQNSLVDRKAFFRKLLDEEDGGLKKRLDSYNKWDYKACCRAFYRLCWDFVEYQDSLYMDDDDSAFGDAGFVIGSPWHGNVAEADIVFVSSNPAITKNCYFPRWHPDINKFSFAGKKFALKDSEHEKLKYQYGFNGTPDLNPGKFKDSEQVFKYLSNRFQDTHEDKESGHLCKLVVDSEKQEIIYKNISKKNGEMPLEVLFWNGIVDATRTLLDMDSEKIKSDHKVLEHVLSTEIIPFGSTRQWSFNERVLGYCWEKFTVPLLENCNAKTLVLVGAMSKNVFNSFLRSCLGVARITNWSDNLYTGSVKKGLLPECLKQYEGRIHATTHPSNV